MLNKNIIKHSASLMDYLVRDGLLEPKDMNNVMRAIENQKVSVVRYLVKENILSSETILTYCEKNFGLTVFDLRYYDMACLKEVGISLEFIYRYRILPLQKDQHYLYVGISDPTDHGALDIVSFHTGLRICPMLVSEAILDQIINLHCSPAILDAKLQTALSKITPIEESVLSAEATQLNDEPVSDFVHRLIQDALLKQISDIHIEPYEKHCRVRFRRDGLLSETTTLPLSLSMRIISRLKIMANLNIAERRLPQDGRIHLNDNALKIDIRINVCPTVYGEKVVLRLLDTKNLHLDIEKLGFNSDQKHLFLQKLTQPQGLILVTGPTGSGKTVTLYSALHYLNRIEKNISSVEDPVEINLYGINQVNINPKIGIHFSNILRTFLRQDPDIIMVGEIRDSETAEIAIQAAQTGHLVLSTLHANNGLETINRLNVLGITADHFLQSAPLLIAQRLVRRLCQACKQPEILPNRLFHQHISTMTYRAIGCEHCESGYKGRTGVFEVIPMTHQLQELMMANKKIALMRKLIHHEGIMLLWESGIEKVCQGVTSYAELKRVLGHG